MFTLKQRVKAAPSEPVVQGTVIHSGESFSNRQEAIDLLQKTVNQLKHGDQPFQITAIYPESETGVIHRTVNLGSDGGYCKDTIIELCPHEALSDATLGVYHTLTHATYLEAYERKVDGHEFTDLYVNPIHPEDQVGIPGLCISVLQEALSEIEFGEDE